MFITLGGGVGVVCTCVSVSLWWVDGTFCEWGSLRRGLKYLMGNRRQRQFVKPFIFSHSRHCLLTHCGSPRSHLIPPPFFPPSLTFQFSAAVLTVVVLTVGGTVLHLWDADQELAVVPEDRHGQFAPALLHQVLGLQQG